MASNSRQKIFNPGVKSQNILIPSLFDEPASIAMNG
jgi:hypothetical protein